MKKFCLISFSVFIFCIYVQNSSAQICVAPPLKVSTVSGIAIFSNGIVLNDISIQLSEDHRGNKIIKTVRTDENGNFSFGEMKAGKYYVLVQNIKYLEDLTFMVKVKKKLGRKHSIGIKIVMESDNPGNCSIAKTIIMNKSL